MKKAFFYICTLFSLIAFPQINSNFGPDYFITIGEGLGGFTGELSAGGRFGRDHDLIGDVNKDGVLDIIVGARSDDDGATDAGAAYVLFMNTNGTVQSHQKISMLEGGFDEILNAGNFFGYGVAGIGDYDDDGIPDVAISAPVSPNNSLYIIHLNIDGTVKDYVKNENTVAQGLSAVGDLNNDGRIDLVACTPKANAGGSERGAIKILFFDDSSQIINSSTVTISSTEGGFGEGLEDGDKFGGREAAYLGDLDNDGNLELAVGAFMTDGGKGAIWILSLDSITHNVISKLKIASGLNGFDEELTTGANPNGTEGANFGHAMCAAGDLNGDGITDLITGANQQNEGEAYILYLNADKTVKSYVKVHNEHGGFDFDLAPEERFSRSISFIGDLRGDGSIAVNFGGGAGSTGLIYILFFEPCDFAFENKSYNWTAQNLVYTNWDSSTSEVTEAALSIEECSYKSLENNASYFSFDSQSGKCFCYNSEASLVSENQEMELYLNKCSNIESTVQTIEFNEGWSIFSTYLKVESMDIETVLSPIQSQLVIVKDNVGNAYLPDWDFNGIGDVVTDEAYLVKASLDCSLTLNGMYMYPELYPIDLEEGWNQFSYLRIENEVDVIAVFNTINDEIVIVKDELGMAYLPDWGFNGISSLQPGKGYQIKCNSAIRLHYLSNIHAY
jgi:hypothetical protein